MSQELINLNPDLKRLKDSGYAVTIQKDYLIVHEIPYVNSKRQIKYGILVSDLSGIAGDQTVGPLKQHVVYFAGEYPCHKDGNEIAGILHQSSKSEMAGIKVNYSFSNKPKNGYQNYFHKMSTYANIISSPAKSLDPSITEKPNKVFNFDQDESVFNYADTNSSRASIDEISKKMDNQKVAIVGLGGTGSYILDLVAKTPVKEIHLFDGDVFLNHNAFRSPGAPLISDLSKVNKKTNYLMGIYSNMHKQIISHPYNISDSNISELSEMNFVFLAIDDSDGIIKKKIVEHLISQQIAFVDTGIGLIEENSSILGHIRVTICTPEKNDHINKRISFASTGEADAYSTNIQIADINALNATLAVMRWKKLFNFYQDLSQEFNTTYSINDGKLFND